MVLHSTLCLIPLLKQICKGLEVYSFVDIMQKHSTLCQQFFVPSADVDDKADGDFIMQNILPKLLDKGSLRETKETAIINFLQDFLQEIESGEERDLDVILGKTRAAATSAQLADTASYSTNASEPQPSSSSPGAAEHRWIQQGAKPKVLSSTPLRKDPWTKVESRNGGRARESWRSRPSSPGDIALHNKFTLLDDEEFPPLRAGARSKDSRSPPPSLGSLTDFPLMRSSTPPAPTPTGGSAGVLPHTSCVIARRGSGGCAASSQRTQSPVTSCDRGSNSAPAGGSTAPRKDPAHFPAAAPASAPRPGPSVLILGSSLVRHVRVKNAYTSCNPGALVQDIKDSAPTILRQHPTVSTVVIHIGLNDLRLQQRHGINFHSYADDTQLYISMSPDDTRSMDALFNCILDIKSWMAENFLQLNQDKTEVLVIGPEAQREKLLSKLQTQSFNPSSQNCFYLMNPRGPCAPLAAGS
ncbi:hypothetical protein WMY93_025539 [Mugilogobius chulae]|uniref:Uncharacterized protein n=1 Tax=Mugilogobius chulae TaxID=88201 RepID=A0AAW0N5X7_9GOBI